MEKDYGQKGHFWALLIDLSKSFDCLSHHPLTATFHVYGFEISSLKLISRYFSKRKSRVKINETLFIGRIYFWYSSEEYEGAVTLF